MGGGVFYTALGASLIGHAGMFYLLQRYEVGLISTLTLLAPVFGVMFGVLVWGDEASWRFLFGGAIVLLGSLVIVEREGGRRLIGEGCMISPNYDERQAEIDMLLLHYTGMKKLC